MIGYIFALTSFPILKYVPSEKYNCAKRQLISCMISYKNTLLDEKKSPFIVTRPSSFLTKGPFPNYVDKILKIFYTLPSLTSFQYISL